MNFIKAANKSMRLGKTSEAKQLYADAIQAYPEIGPIIKFNLDYLERLYGSDEKGLLLEKKSPTRYIYERANVRKFLKKLESLEFDTYEEYRDHYERNESKALKVLVGTLFSGENEIQSCKKSVANQSYPKNLVEHVVIEYLPKKEAMDTLYRTFLNSDKDILVKLDADMILADQDFIANAVRVFKHNESISMLQCSLTDFYSGEEMQGINVYSKDMVWESTVQDRLFTDKTKTPKDSRKIEWSKFTRSVFHSPNPTAFQAFHFGVHRAIKAREAALAGESGRASEQLMYIERTYRHYAKRKDPRLLYSSVGAELAMYGKYNIEHLDYTNPELESIFENEIKSIDKGRLELRLRLLRSGLTPFSSVNEIRRRREKVAEKFSVKKALLIVPHAGIYGGINRFLEIGKSLSRKGVSATVGVRKLNVDSIDYKKMLSSFPEVRVCSLDICMKEEWDLAVCGDFSSGVMLSLGEVKARVTAAYILNGWQHRERNIQQIKLVNPDVIFANSSYAEKCYIDLCPTLAQGAVDLNVFNPEGTVKRNCTDTLKVVVPGGRLKPRKRIRDAVKAVNNLVKMGCSVEMHVFNAEHVHIDCLANTQIWVALNREEVAGLIKSCHVVLCPEEDAGWNNPAAEALACGVPLICTEAGTTDFSEDGKTSFVVPPRDVEAMTESLKYIYDHPEKAYEMAALGFSRVKQFTWSSVSEKILASVEKCRPFDLSLFDKKRRKFINMLDLDLSAENAN